MEWEREAAPRRRRGRYLAAAAAVAAVALVAAAAGEGGRGAAELEVGDEREPASEPAPAGEAGDQDLAALAVGPWALLPAAPIAGREGHTAVWTGTELLVWGGVASGADPAAAQAGADGAAGGAGGPAPVVSARGDGAAYEPASGRWRRIPAAPTGPRSEHTAVWTGTEMLVWGGRAERGGDGHDAGGAAYHPGTGTWRRLPPAPLPGRTLHTAVWTGAEMIVWGGSLTEEEGDGAAYDPVTDTWRPLSPAPLPARAAHTAVWTGTEMLVWGGIGRDGVPSAEGAAYDPVRDAWRPLSAAPLAGRTQHVAVWTGAQMLLWGGASDVSTGVAYADGAALDPATGGWSALPPVDLQPRFASSAVWTGQELVVWGGVDAEFYRDGAAYHPAAGTWRRLPEGPVADPTRYPAVWTGSAMVVWAGLRGPSAAAYSPDGSSSR
jgi:N-acetylneuraminic acid mutarotase